MADLPPVTEFAFPGPLRDRLVGAILTGEKTATTGLVREWELDDDPLPQAGQRQTVIDSAEKPVAIIEITDVQVMRLADVDLQIAFDEGEGFTSVAEWRAAHEDFWNGYMDEPGWELTDDTPVLVERFRMVERLGT
ncbi:ASCH domain-containing protein [Svornostia abyssi]|uniref:ASCH domain-containing protein n=1 Tax=Svornostia abyssi TaxID=2898438 RepID=A0ABY5PIA7_9ACTN|nr:ASCH domain-containing protein [Parviterribacteraceae bacterium J379]